MPRYELIQRHSKAIRRIGYFSKTPLMKVRVDWEVDNEEDLHHLPEVVPIYEKILLDEVADYISDRYGYLVKGFSIESI